MKDYPETSQTTTKHTSSICDRVDQGSSRSHKSRRLKYVFFLPGLSNVFIKIARGVAERGSELERTARSFIKHRPTTNCQRGRSTKFVSIHFEGGRANYAMIMTEMVFLYPLSRSIRWPLEWKVIQHKFCRQSSANECLLLKLDCRRLRHFSGKMLWKRRQKLLIKFTNDFGNLNHFPKTIYFANGPLLLDLGAIRKFSLEELCFQRLQSSYCLFGKLLYWLIAR